MSVIGNFNSNYGRFQKFMLGKIVDFSLKWVNGVLLVQQF